MRVTVACPEALVSDANQLVMCLAYSKADGETYRLPCGWQDAEGNLYSAASWEASEEWLAAAQQPLQRPAWDTDEVIDMEAAARAQAALVFWVPGEDAPAPEAAPDALTVIVGVPGAEAVALMGLKQVETP